MGTGEAEPGLEPVPDQVPLEPGVDFDAHVHFDLGSSPPSDLFIFSLPVSPFSCPSSPPGGRSRSVPTGTEQGREERACACVRARVICR